MKITKTKLAIALAVSVVMIATLFTMAEKSKLTRHHKDYLVLQEQLLSSQKEAGNAEIAAAQLSEQNKLLKKQLVDNQSLISKLDERVKDLESKKVIIASSTYKLIPTSMTVKSEWTTFKASYYNAGYVSTGKTKGSQGYGITYSGRNVTKDVTIAVDPNVIPLDSWVEIKHSDGRTELRRADDTGSAIHGNKIDIYMEESDSILMAMGIDKVQIRILKELPSI
jgi:3D (Asp-Asp-Asp) domain-containing protein